MVSTLRRLMQLVIDDWGISGVEYAVMLALIGVALVASMLTFGNQVLARFVTAAAALVAP